MFNMATRLAIVYVSAAKDTLAQPTALMIERFLNIPSTSKQDTQLESFWVHIHHPFQETASAPCIIHTITCFRAVDFPHTAAPAPPPLPARPPSGAAVTNGFTSLCRTLGRLPPFPSLLRPTAGQSATHASGTRSCGVRPG